MGMNTIPLAATKFDKVEAVKMANLVIKSINVYRDKELHEAEEYKQLMLGKARASLWHKIFSRNATDAELNKKLSWGYGYHFEYNMQKRIAHSAYSDRFDFCNSIIKMAAVVKEDFIWITDKGFTILNTPIIAYKNEIPLENLL